MKKDFSHQFKIIYDYFKSSKAAQEFGASKLALAKFLEVSQGKMQHWEKGNWPNTPDIALLHSKLGFAYHWLVTGEGDPYDTSIATDSKKTTSKLQSVPMRGFAACSLMGWSGSMTLPTAITAPHMREGMIGVMASGESMLPEGIGHGHICWCDPNAEPVPGECVYVEQCDGHHTLKTFLGRGLGVGANTAEDQIALRGWLDKDYIGLQREVFISVPEFTVKIIAPVIYVQRRL